MTSPPWAPNSNSPENWSPPKKEAQGTPTRLDAMKPQPANISLMHQPTPRMGTGTQTLDLLK